MQATLYVFFPHVYFALLIAHGPGLDPGHVLLTSVAHTLTLGLLWLLVKRASSSASLPR
jgi:hypothetical protein